MTTKKTTHMADTPQWMYYSRSHHSVSGDVGAWEEGWFDVDHSISLTHLEPGVTYRATITISGGDCNCREDVDITSDNVATIEFVVTVDPDVIDGTVIENQAFVSAVGGGVVDQPSDDPRTDIDDDPTRDVVGNLPLLFAEKSAALQVDGSPRSRVLRFATTNGTASRHPNLLRLPIRRLITSS